MSNDYEDFESLYNSTNATNSNSGWTPTQPASLTEAQVRAIASDQHLRDLQAMQQAAQAANQRRAAALERAEERHPGFTRLYGDGRVTDRFKKERPRTADLIGGIEVGLGGDDTALDEAYDSFFNEARQYESRPDVKHLPASGFTLTEINRLPLSERRERIQSLLERVGDEPLDSADPSAEVFRLERGEK